MDRFMGVDIGGTNVKIGVVQTDGAMEHKTKYSTSELLDSGDFVQAFVEILRKELARFPDIKKIGIGVPGTLTKDRSTLLEIPAINVLNGVRIKEVLESHFPDKSFRLENDANAAALGEYYFSGEKMPENYLFITLGTGIGSAAIIDHDVFTGGDGNSMEMGHMLAKNGKSLEENIGKSGIMQYAESKASGKKSKISDLVDPDPKKILELAEEGDKIALKVYRKMGKYLGEALVSTIRLLDVKTILIGGGLAKSLDIVLPPAMKVLKKNLTPYYLEDLEVRKAKLGNNAGIVGAAALCFK
jgi:glucokinase